MSTINSFYLPKKELMNEKIWDVDFNINSKKNWIRIETDALNKDKNEMSCLKFSKFSFMEFKINYEKLLTCYIASKIENERIAHAKRKREERKKLMQKLFIKEVETYSFNNNQSNHENDFNMEDTNEVPARQIKNHSFLMNEQNPSKNFISKPKNNSIYYKSNNNNPKMKEFNFRKTKMKSEIEELFEQEGKTIWNFSFSEKLKQGLLQDLEQFMYLSKNEIFEEMNTDNNFNQEIMNLKQSVDVIIFILN